MSSPAASPDSIEARETAERVKLLFEFSPQAYLASAAIAVATAFFLPEVPRLALIAWAASVVLICTLRYGLYLAYQRRPASLADAPAWERRFTIGAGLTGFAWAALPIGLFPERSSEMQLEMQLVVTFIVAVVAMGGTASLGPSRKAFVWFLAPIAVGMVARLFVEGGSILTGLGIVAFLYVALLARIWREFHRSLTGTIRARFENVELIAKLRDSQEMLADAIDGLPEAIAIYDAEDRLILCNRKYALAQTAIEDPAQLVGRTFAELVRLSVEKGEVIEPEYAGNVEAWVAERIRRRRDEAGGAGRVYQIADGRWMLTSISRTRTGGLVAVRTDITREREIERSLHSALLEEQRIMDTATVGIVFLKDRKVVKCNRQFAELFAYTPQELVGHSSAIWFPSVENWEKVGQQAYATVERGEPFELEQEFVRKNGERIWCHVAGRILDPYNWDQGSIWVYSDITESKRREAEARNLAHHDALTGLPNRRLLDDRMIQALASARRSQGRLAIMLLDLDHFKPINDAHGHEAGDEVLKIVAARLKTCVRESDTVARVGGDEFVVMLPVRDSEDAASIAQKILHSLAEPVPVAGERFAIGCSIGISQFPEDSPEKEELLKHADRAMYLAKAAGRNGYRFYAREMPASARAGIG